MLSYGRTVIQV